MKRKLFKKLHAHRRSAVFAVIGLMALLPIGMLSSGSEPPNEAGISPLEVKVRDLHIIHEVMAVFVMPGERVPIQCDQTAEHETLVIMATGGSVQSSNDTEWVWHAPPEPGLYPFQISSSSTNRKMVIQFFVMVPASDIQKGFLNGYPIGEYPSKPLKNLDAYQAPIGFVEVTAENENAQLSPHFCLKQFLCKDDKNYPKYVVVQEDLLLKLERIFTSLNSMGLVRETLTVMSGYRTPAYNCSIGNVRYSQHVYGGAADIYIDDYPRDGIMDDLNNDGIIDFQDAQFLYTHIDHLSILPGHESLPGGLGAYEQNEAHGPFVHVDVRGYQARWIYAGGGS